ncbi:ExbD/TolR family protein [Pelagibaculum spongiae]|uniref:Biopolymer transporter ExbD n=1 Tax=Pelagibaculum spongiae TaxID=2080658 RepID=A0A2V1GV60_9GAMM|nr:biopolymer transporter ExbD [Pelagibaculum spongiae]PVZ62981.1 biopolymer transporter ExbD [Pelagibaculum spongiae]
MALRFHRHKDRGDAELNITAFLNLMVVLIPFLLLTAVFSQVTILELNLPVGQSEALEDSKPKLQLELLIRKETIQVADRSGVTYGEPIKKTEDGFDFNQLNKQLVTIKEALADTPDDTEEITLLFEPEVEYDVLVQAMDAVRVRFPEAENESANKEQELAADAVTILLPLFPEVSIGDAPQAPKGDAG